MKKVTARQFSSASSDRLRISNIPHLAGVPYKYLSSLPFVDYEEADPVTNALRLRIGELDAALIPAVEFLSQPDYVCLGFGMGSRQRTDSMLLYAERPLSELRVIHVYNCACSSLALLRLLYKELVGTCPEIVRHDAEDISAYVSCYEGALVLHPLPDMLDRGYRVHMDLGEAWYKHTGRPFLFLVWAAREDVFSDGHYREFHRACFKAARLSSEFAADYSMSYGAKSQSCQDFVGGNRRYYLDSFLMKGFWEFVSRSKDIGILGTPSFSLRTQRPFAKLPSMFANSLLD